MFNIVKNPRCDGCQCGLPLVAYRFFDKKCFAMHAINLLMALKVKECQTSN